MQLFAISISHRISRGHIMHYIFNKSRMLNVHDATKSF